MAVSRNLVLLAARSVVGGYLAAHGAQKLFGSFDGPGIDAAAGGFEHLGLKPGKVFARLAAVSELAGGALTAAGAAAPLGPVVLAGTMAVASATHRANGPFAAKGGYELALTDFAAAAALGVAGPGRFSVDGLLGRRLPASLRRLVVAGAVAVSGASLAMVLRAKPPAAPAASDAVPEPEPAPPVGASSEAGK
ncbi:DoxX family protein [Acidiferrimicrobium sp. IK]|uniref:DoxX family protein n=1 Tax=Acidiferrimicrobium sp. IK TaxID=2871700 RepID=UPI0021CB4DAF|nr:DoxX family protein [Acidiferrimicrobium sp. IK]MCU4182806.1 DoxX family protein [Acidiferrimicrobium sp. IK]